MYGSTRQLCSSAFHGAVHEFADRRCGAAQDADHLLQLADAAAFFSVPAAGGARVTCANAAFSGNGSRSI